ncbi:MAG: KH domain-containing protein [Simkaniaceae bacterium]
MKDFIAYIVKNIVSNPDAVEVTESSGEQTIIIDIKVAQEDIAKVIGKQGRTIKSLRIIAASVAARLKRHIRIEVIQ